MDAGEELSISYIRLLQSTEDRRRQLQQWGFFCECDTCADWDGESDARRERMGDLMEDLEDLPSRDGGETSPDECRERLEKASELVQLLEDAGLEDYLRLTYHLAATFSRDLGLDVLARAWATKELAPQ